ncbi:S8 family serine peptidase [Thermaerobacter litoralis]
MERWSRRIPALLAVLLVLALAGNVVAAVGPVPRHDFTEGDAGAAAGGTGYAIVQLVDPPAASYTGGIGRLKATKPAPGKKLDARSRDVKAYVDYLKQRHEEFKASLASVAPRARVVREFFLTGNALVVELNGHSPDELARGRGAKRVTPSGLYRPAMNVSAGLIEADEVWALLDRSGRWERGRERAGEGIKVGVIDSGIDRSHPFFRCKDRDGDGDVDEVDIPSKVYASGVAGDPSNVLVNDHGTHVAGTIAGCVTTLTEGPVQDTLSGIAPAAELYDYNVFPGFGAGWVAYGGSAFSHDIAAALEDAVRDGMDVVNMSLGGGVQGPHDYLAEAVNAAVDAGVVVAVAAGNSGPGDMTVESPGSAAKAITVGASTNPHYIGIPVTAGGRSFGAAPGDFAPFGQVTAPYAIARDGSANPTQACYPLVNAAEVAGKIALVDRGSCTFTTKVRNAEQAGAIGVLIVNNVAGDPSAPGQDGTTPVPQIPAAMVSRNDGAFLKQLLQADPGAQVSIDGTVLTEIRSENADILAGFSSHGPTPFTYLIKPDVTAPGVNIYSSVFHGEYAMFQGTSMATPHVAGAAAVLRQLHPDWSPADVKSALVNTAARVVRDPFTASRDPGVLARGGGRIDLARAHATPVTLDPVSISFGYFNGNAPVSGEQALTLHNVSGTRQTCTVTVVRDATDPAVTVSAGSVTLDPGAYATLTVSMEGGRSDTTPSGDYDGELVFRCGGKELRAPWWLRVDREAKP